MLHNKEEVYILKFRRKNFALYPYYSIGLHKTFTE